MIQINMHRLIIISIFLMTLTACSTQQKPTFPIDNNNVDEWIEKMRANPAQPQIEFHYKENSTWTDWNKSLFASAIGGQVADGVTTINKLDEGCTEANPLVGDDPSKATVILIKVGALGLGYMLAEYVFDGAPEARNWIYCSLAVSGIGAAAWNSTRSCN